MTIEVHPKKVYFATGAALLILLVLTVAAALVPLGGYNHAASMLIAVLKAALVVVFFMHLRWSSPIMRLFACAGLVWLAILMALTLSDYLTRPI